jgi:hypothetical protein
VISSFLNPRALLVQGATSVLLVVLLIPLLSGSKRELFLVALLGGICAFWIIQRPHWGVLLILASWFVQLDAVAGIPYVISAILVIPLGLAMLRDRGTWLLQVPQIRIFLIIGFLFLVSTWWNEFKYPVTLFPEEDETVRHLTVFGTRLIWLMFFLYFITTRQRIELTIWLAGGLITAAAITALPAVLSSERAYATFSFARNSNRLAYICLFATTLIWFYRFHAPASRWKGWLLPILFFFPVVALAAGSRSGFFQMIALAAVILKEQNGWSVTRRAYSVFLLGSVGFLLLTVVPAVHLERVTNFVSPSVESVGGESFHNRAHFVFQAMDMIMADPIFGVGIGNFAWVSRAFYPSGGEAHNSYLWAFTSGGIGVFALYLLLFYVTYRMLKRLESLGPQDLRWLSKALKTNLILFLIFSAFADFWLNFFLYLIIGLTIAMTHLWRSEQQKFGLNRPVTI